jgi:hypothetical protein
MNDGNVSEPNQEHPGVCKHPNKCPGEQGMATTTSKQIHVQIDGRIDPSELCVVQRRILVSFRQVSEVHAKQKVVSLQEARQKVHIRQRLDKCFHIIISEQVCEFIVFSSYKKRHKDACTLGMEGGIVRRGGNVPVQNVPCHAGVQASDAFRFRDGAPK